MALDWIWLLGMAVLLLAAIWILARGRRRLRAAAAQLVPRGTTDSVSALQSRLAYGMPAGRLIELAGSLGEPAAERDGWRWTDVRGNELIVTVHHDTVVRWAAAHHEPSPTPAA